MSGPVQDDLASWLEHDEVTASLNAYADPFVLIDVERVDYEGKSFIAIRVLSAVADLQRRQADAPNELGEARLRVQTVKRRA